MFVSKRSMDLCLYFLSRKFSGMFNCLQTTITLGLYWCGDVKYYSEKESMYMDVFEDIHQFNKENLNPEEVNNSAFSWFIEEGFNLLFQKAKVTVPIDKRVPAKKNIANNHSIKKHSNVVKNETEWGYVAQVTSI
jgi:hypothetical protein